MQMHLPPVPVVGTQRPPFKHGFVAQNVTTVGAAVVVAAVTVTGPTVVGVTVPGREVTEVTTELPMLQ